MCETQIKQIILSLNLIGVVAVVILNRWANHYITIIIAVLAFTRLNIQSGPRTASFD